MLIGRASHHLLEVRVHTHQAACLWRSGPEGLLWRVSADPVFGDCSATEPLQIMRKLTRLASLCVEVVASAAHCFDQTR